MVSRIANVKTAEPHGEVPRFLGYGTKRIIASSGQKESFPSVCGVFYQNSPGMQIIKCSFEETILAKSFAIRYIINGIGASERLRFEKIKEMDILRKQ